MSQKSLPSHWGANQARGVKLRGSTTSGRLAQRPGLAVTWWGKLPGTSLRTNAQPRKATSQLDALRYCIKHQVKEASCEYAEG